MMLKATLNDSEEWFYVDTGFSGDVIVNYEIFDAISSPIMDVGDICISTEECYKGFGKISSINVNGREASVIVIWIPNFNENLIGERALIRLGLVINYKDLEITDP
ncbi:clan AA aspartic protease [Acidianus brierleyi]|nr:clan AA aspartic protease [Acidianus brierleyi]AWR93748.2 clan AA aspartic protease [Acidianus brierleyi]